MRSCSLRVVERVEGGHVMRSEVREVGDPEVEAEVRTGGLSHFQV